MPKNFMAKQTILLGKARKGIMNVPIAGKAYETMEDFGLRMGFANLMYSYGWLFRMTAFKHDTFKDRLAEKDFTVLMEDKDKVSQRWFTFSEGKLSTTSSNGPEPKFSLIWKTVPDGCKVMADMAMGKPKVLKNAIMDGNLLLAGDASMVGWFLETNNIMSRLNRKPRKKTDNTDKG